MRVFGDKDAGDDIYKMNIEDTADEADSAHAVPYTDLQTTTDSNREITIYHQQGASGDDKLWHQAKSVSFSSSNNSYFLCGHGDYSSERRGKAGGKAGGGAKTVEPGKGDFGLYSKEPRL